MTNLKVRAGWHALAMLVYVSLVAAIMRNGNQLFGEKDNYFMPVAALLLLVLSASVSGALVLGKPILLYVEGRKAEAIKMFFWTIGWLAALTVLVLVVLMLIKQ
jgi:hypothetical protein